MSIIQLRVRAVPQPAPPGSEPSSGIAERIESVQRDTIHTSVTAIRKSGVIAAQFAGHERGRYTRQTRFSTAPAGATFSERSLGKSVDPCHSTMRESVDHAYPPDCMLRLILDNHSAHHSKETQAFLATRPNRIKYVLTPTHGRGSISSTRPLVRWHARSRGTSGFSPGKNSAAAFSKASRKSTPNLLFTPGRSLILTTSNMVIV